MSNMFSADKIIEYVKACKKLSKEKCTSSTG